MEVYVHLGASAAVELETEFERSFELFFDIFEVKFEYYLNKWKLKGNWRLKRSKGAASR